MKLFIEVIEFYGIEVFCLNGLCGFSVIISKFGGQVLFWLMLDGCEYFFFFDKVVFDGSVVICGGILVCFLQFFDFGDLLKYGFVCMCFWLVSVECCGDDFVLIILEILDDEEMWVFWLYFFYVEIMLMIEVDCIDVEFCVINIGGMFFSFIGVLYIYLCFVQVEDVVFEGLCGYVYCDVVNGNQMVFEFGIELIVEKFVDCVYYDVKWFQLLKVVNLSLGIQNQGFLDVVVWNFWVEFCVGMKDMLVDGWWYMFCVEVVVVQNVVILLVGEEWYGWQILVVV